jgi:hypothetical protein
VTFIFIPRLHWSSPRNQKDNDEDLAGNRR